MRTIVDKNGGQVPRKVDSALFSKDYLLIRVMWRTVWDEEFRLKLYDDSDGAAGQVLNLKVMRKEGREEELIGEGNVRIDGKSWREFDGESNPSYARVV